MDILILLILSVILCYIYAFISGFTDASNAIATAVGSRSLTPGKAVLMASVLEVIGAMAGTAVALTIGKGLVSLEMITLHTVAAALLGAMAWSLITYVFGIPVSETHGLVGGIIGAAVAGAGFSVVIWAGLGKVLLAIIISPLIGFASGLVMMKVITPLCAERHPKKMVPLFRNLQRVSSAFMAFSHGLNDAQKPMGILVMLLALYYGWKDPAVPLWIIITMGIVAGLGIAAGGWKIMKTIGMKMAPLRVEQGFAAQTSAAVVLQIASLIGAPISTTHTITSSIIGAGVARRRSSLRWGIVMEIGLSWIVTLPVTFILGWIFARGLMAIF